MLAIQNNEPVFDINNLTEKEAYDIINFNWKQGRLQQSSNYQVKYINELQRVLGLGLTLKLKSPAWRENEIYTLLTNKKDYFDKLGVTYNPTPLLTYKAILYILVYFDFPLKHDYSKVDKVSITPEVDFEYTEDEAFNIILHNRAKLEESAGYTNITTDILKPKVLASILKLRCTGNLAGNSIYVFIKENLPILETLGCSQKHHISLTYRGVLYLLMLKDYPLDLNLKSNVIKFPVSKIEQEPVATSNVVETVKTDKPDTEHIKSYIKKAVKERRAILKQNIEKTKESETDLKIVEEALFLAKRLESLLVVAKLK